MKIQPKHMWMSLPVLLLTMSVSIGMTGYLLASSGHNAETEKDFYSQAANWDAHQALVASSLELGWKALVVPGALVAGSDVAEQSIDVAIRLSDGEGSPVSGANAVLEAFQLARKDHVVNAVLLEKDPGSYHVTMQPRHAGRWLWVVRFEVGEQVFLAELQQTILVRANDPVSALDLELDESIESLVPIDVKQDD